MFSTNVDTRMEYTTGDSILIKNIVSQLKSQGVFDQFRKECISDVDTKPAYQNLCHRVDGRVEAYLSDIKWGPGLNKNQLRENIRKHVNECSFVDSGISRIVDQLVNPRINTVLVPKVEDIVYSYLGIARPENEQFKNNRLTAEKMNTFSKHHEDVDEKPDVGIVPKHEPLVSSFNQHMKLSSNQDVSSDSKNEIERKPTLPSTESMSLSTINACSDIDSDEDDMSPPFEPHVKSDVESGDELDYSMDLSDAKDDVEPEQLVNVKSNSDCPKFESPEPVKLDDSDKIFRNLERICGEESMDSATSSCTDKMSSRKPSSSLDLPNTPTINYETDESQDNHFRKNIRRESAQNEICAPDTSSMDSFVEKVLENERVSPNNLVDDDCFTPKTINKEEKEQGDTDPNKKNTSESKLSDSKDSRRNHKHSESKKDKNRKSDKNHKSSKDKYKDRSNHKSSQISKEGHSRDRKDNDKNKRNEKLSKENDPKHRDSSKSSTSSNKNRSSGSKSKSDESKDDRKKRSSSSKHDSEKDRERSKHRKEESNEVKKSKTQCNTDSKKKKTDRRSSDRDGTGPPSSSHSSSHHSSTKTDKEKHRHSSSSSSSSSHKTKKNVETKNSDRAADALFDTMMLVTGSANVASDPLITPSDMNINNASSIFELLNDSSEDSISDNKKDLSNEEIDGTAVLSQSSVNDNPTKDSSNHTDDKLKIKTVYSHCRLPNGSCTPIQAQNHRSIAGSDSNVSNKNEDSHGEKHVKVNLETHSKNMKVNGLLENHSGSRMISQDTEKVHGTRNYGCGTIEAEQTVSKNCVLEEEHKVRYFEPAELNRDFINFVAKRVKESEELYMENFSIHLKCPERYDNILRDNLGAIVKRRCCKSETTSSPFKYNSEIIDSKIGNEKSIMMRIKKTIPEKELFTLPFGMDYMNGLPEETVGEVRGTFSINISTNSNKTVLAKRKTLGVKRRLSNQAKVTKPKIDSKNYNSLMRCSENVQTERIDVGSNESFDGSQIPRSLAPDNQRSLYQNTNSVNSSEPPPPKIQKVISKEQKRKQFYYDANDLYKPRPSFLFSSRRSRGLDPNTT